MSGFLGVYMDSLVDDFDGVELKIVFSVFQKESIVEDIYHKDVRVTDLLDQSIIDWAESKAADYVLDPDYD
jgi:hypothetical protein